MSQAERALLLSKVRRPGEPLDSYRSRRKAIDMALRTHLRGRYVHVASQIVTLPANPTSEQMAQWLEGTARGHIRDYQTVTLRNGDVISVGRTKGVTYRKPLREAV